MIGRGDGVSSPGMKVENEEIGKYCMLVVSEGFAYIATGMADGCGYVQPQEAFILQSVFRNHEVGKCISRLSRLPLFFIQ